MANILVLDGMLVLEFGVIVLLLPSCLGLLLYPFMLLLPTLLLSLSIVPLLLLLPTELLLLGKVGTIPLASLTDLFLTILLLFLTIPVLS